MNQTPRRTFWDEAEMREIAIEPPPRRARNLGSSLRAHVSALAPTLGKPYQSTRGSAVIFEPNADSHGNFLEASYRRILANPAWARRLAKAHTARRQARPTGPEERTRDWRELDAATSSDALLMNIFCYPRVWTSGLKALLGVTGREPLRFGVRSQAKLARNLVNTTEIDLQIGDLLVEAKLTEAGFQCAPLRLLERHTAFDQHFDRDLLESTPRGIRSYQLVRGVLAAQAIEGRFAVLLDARRTDLIADWFQTIRAVRSFDLQSRLRLVTWQEIAAVVPRPLQHFLAQKYQIVAPASSTRSNP